MATSSSKKQIAISSLMNLFFFEQALLGSSGNAQQDGYRKKFP
jgi:hypothetical protein